MLAVVGGHSRNIGKTSVAAAIIRALPQGNWTAMKITQTGHGVCSSSGGSCGCEPEDPAHPFAIDEEREPSETDTGRFLAAGAAHSLWVRTRMGELALAMPEIRRWIAASPNTIAESNTLLDFVVPCAYIAVIDFSVSDMKNSARRFLDRANALAIVGDGVAPPGWQGLPARWLEAKPRFRVDPPDYASAALADFIRPLLSLESPECRPGG